MSQSVIDELKLERLRLKAMAEKSGAESAHFAAQNSTLLADLANTKETLTKLRAHAIGKASHAVAEMGARVGNDLGLAHSVDK